MLFSSSSGGSKEYLDRVLGDGVEFLTAVIGEIGGKPNVGSEIRCRISSRRISCVHGVDKLNAALM